MVDLDATLGEKLFEVPVGQPIPEVPNRQVGLVTADSLEGMIDEVVPTRAGDRATGRVRER